MSQEGTVQPKRLVASVFLLLIGIVIGVTLVSELQWLPAGDAVNAPKTKPQAAIGGERTFAEIAKAVTPAVVNISTTRVSRREDDPSLSPFEDPFFRRFFGDEFFRHPGVPRERKEKSLGSGVLVDASGLIITNNHVVSKADEITVLLSDKREMKGKLVGSDPKSDLAVVRVEAENLPTIAWADSDALAVGEYVLAIGNPFGLTQTVTMGIVSAIGRADVGVADYEDFIQTDAAINPGNSGGALVDIRGQLVGINTAIFTQSGGYMGIGFAVPSNMARSVLESLVKTGKVVRSWMGVSIQEVTPQLAKEFGLAEPKGALVADVLPDSPAEAAGLKRGDVVLSVMGQPIENAAQLRNHVARIAVGARVKVVVIRDGKEKVFEVKVEEQPRDIAQAGTSDEEREAPALAGVEVRNLTQDLAQQLELGRGLKGVVVTRVEEDSPAAGAGLMRGDLIMEINRRPVRDTGAYQAVLEQIGPNTGILLLVYRQGRALFLSVSPE